jgi:hypothetical protein
MSEPNERSSGRLKRAAQNLPAVEVDCSGWKRAEGPRSHGNLRSAAQNMPPVTVDCSGWKQEPAEWLELVVSFDGTATPATVFGQTVRLIDSLRTVHRQHGLALEYDADRSRTDGERVVVALRLSAGASAEQRERVIAATRAELAKLTGARLERLEWSAAA